jgi:exopolyphosphatase/guanosine-5'-triphosphate,3'-diphosphate pyrophosphatase
VKSDPAHADELARVRDDILAALATIARPRAGATLVGVAGTVTTLAAIALELDDYDPSRVHGHVLTKNVVHAIGERLARLPLSERRAVTGLDPRRADVITAGTLIVDAVMTFSGSETLIVSDRGVRWGLAEELAKLV